MRAINVGVAATRETELTVVLAGAGAGSILRITRADPAGSTVAPCVGDGWTVTLSPGDYLVTVDSEAPPHGARPLTVRVSAPVWFLSVDAEDGAASLVAWSASELVATEPGWPRPPAGARAATGALDRSPIRGAILTLVDATAGARGGSAAAIHALLIGIDSYPRGPGPGGAIYRSLRGCVRDIVEVEALLRRDVGVPRERITRLLAATDDSELRAAAAGTPRPTYANIVERWLAIIAAAAPGDILYVHYSGHGGRARTAFPAIKVGGLDEALAPCDINDRAAGKYLRDVEIAALLAKAAAKGVLTTLVLDACHSGSATRGREAQARRGDSDDQAPRADQLATSLVDTPSALADIARELEHGQRGLEVTWRVDQRGNASSLNTVIAACRKGESAYEYEVDGVHRQGALTYFWLEALRRRDAALTYRDAYRQVFAGVQGVFAAQSPVLLGAGDRVVLGTVRLAQARSIAVLGVDGDRVTLAAGESGLVDVGTRLAMIPRDVVPELAELSELPHVEVIRVAATSSVARVLTRGRPGDVAAGAQAVIVRYAPRMQRNVRLLDEHCTSESAAAFTELEDAIAADTTNLLAVDPSRGADYQVVIDARSGAPVFSIVDPAGMPLPHLLPDIAIRERDAAPRIKDRLVHLARFSNVLNLTNDDPRSPLANKLGLTLHADVDGQCAPEPLPERPTIRAGTDFHVRIANRSSRPLIAALFDLTSDRKVEMFRQTWDLDPNSVQDIRVKAVLRPGHRAITDVLKVIATLGMVSFDWMMLPALDHMTTRGGAPAHKRAPSNPFEALMKAMQVPRGPTRTFEVARAPTRDWTEARVTVDVVE
jgi:hypothetical protein